MSDDMHPPGATHIADHTLRLLRSLGLAGVIGGLGALVAMWGFTTQPADQQQWRLLVGAMRAVFYACVFTGIVILVPVGVTLWWRQRAALRGRRWFHAMMVILIITVPALHIAARLTSNALRLAVDAAELDAAAMLWNRLGWLFAIALIVFLIASWIGTSKPRMGQAPVQRG